MSAIRIVDLFYVSPLPAAAPEGALPIVQAWVCAALRFDGALLKGDHYLEPKMMNVKGEITSLGDPIKVDLELAPTKHMKGVPLGVNIGIQLNLGVRNLGTCYLLIYLDGEQIARTPFTLLPISEFAGPDKQN